MLRAQGPGAGGRRRLLVSVSPRLGRERERRVPGAGRARSESYSAARWSGPHVTGGGTASSRHRPGGGSCKRAQTERLGGALHGGVRDLDFVPLRGSPDGILKADVGLWGLRAGLPCFRLFVGPGSLRISYSSLTRRIQLTSLLILTHFPFPAPYIHTIMEQAEFRDPLSKELRTGGWLNKRQIGESG
ncbi:hypothetical protein NN561_016023 [Cricetulus griseus]